MDIYSFLNSADIAEHCRKIGKAWTPYEMAIIIGRSHRTLAERHTAWRELIDNYPDMPTPANIHYDSRESLHSEIMDVIVYERKLLNYFKTPEEGAVYSYRKYDDGQRFADSIFTTFEAAWKDAMEWEREEAPEIVIAKEMVDNRGKVEAEMDYDGNIYRLHADYNREEKYYVPIPYVSMMDFCNMCYVDIPVPFKKGDILTCSYRHKVAKGEEFLLVLEYLNRDNEKWFAGAISGKNGDGSDLYGTGYCVGESGELGFCDFHDHDNLVYFRGKLSGKERLLQYVSWYLKNEIGLVLLMQMQCRVIARQILEDVNVRRGGWLHPKEHIVADEEADHIESPHFTAKIEIENKENIEARAKEPFSDSTALISIADANDDFAVLENRPEHILQLKFDDVDESDEPQDKYHMLTDEQAKNIAAFIKRMSGQNTLICQCEYGQSRSAAIAAACRQYFYGDGIEIFADERYYPNRFIYQKILNALRG